MFFIFEITSIKRLSLSLSTEKYYHAAKLFLNSSFIKELQSKKNTIKYFKRIYFCLESYVKIIYS